MSALNEFTLHDVRNTSYFIILRQLCKSCMHPLNVHFILLRKVILHLFYTACSSNRVLSFIFCIAADLISSFYAIIRRRTKLFFVARDTRQNLQTFRHDLCKCSIRSRGPHAHKLSPGHPIPFCRIAVGAP